MPLFRTLPSRLGPGVDGWMVSLALHPGESLPPSALRAASPSGHAGDASGPEETRLSHTLQQFLEERFGSLTFFPKAKGVPGPLGNKYGQCGTLLTRFKVE